MKTLLITTPLRPTPSDFPPFGSLCLLNALRKSGYDNCTFFNIDALRPSYEETLERIKEEAPDVLAISAVVSTAYAYTKKITSDVKRLLPGVKVVVGGNMAASAEILLQKAGVDVCVVGEGEIIFCNLIKHFEQSGLAADLSDVRGLVYLDGEGKLVNTGYETTLSKEEIYDIDWDDLEKSSDIGMFFYGINAPESEYLTHFKNDPRTHEAHRQDKTVGSLYCSKGCVSRCTFCHRWDKGVRYIPVDLVMQRIEEIIDRYNVGFLNIVDENFGSDKKWLAEFCERIKAYDLLWHVAGMRVNTAKVDDIKMMKDAGCVAAFFGMETGSASMLAVMEKKVTLDDNYNAAKWIVDAGLSTVSQLVIGMPGETRKTILETAEFCKYVTTLNERQNPSDLSINYAQALPGTPLYEYARSVGIIGKDIDSEEEYLLRISDKDAHDEFTTLNFTDDSDLECQTWRPLIQISVNFNYLKTFGRDHYRAVLMKGLTGLQIKEEAGKQDRGYFANPKRLLDTAEINEIYPSLFSLMIQRKFGLAMLCYPGFFYRMKFLLPLMVLLKNAHYQSVRYSMKLLVDHVRIKLMKAKARKFKYEYKSLRKIVDAEDFPRADSSEEMEPLRKGR